MYCQSAGKLACELISPCQDVLKLQAASANYQARIWKSSLTATINALDPVGHGWCSDENENLDIKWMTCNPTPEEVR